MTRTIHVYLVCYELGIVLIRRKHENIHSIVLCHLRYCAYDIICLVTLNLQYGDVVGLQYIFYNRYARTNVLRGFFTLCLVLSKGFVTESLAMIKCHSEMGGFLFLHNLVERVAESHYGTRVESLAVNARRPDECVVAAIDDGIGIYKEYLTHIL